MIKQKNRRMRKWVAVTYGWHSKTWRRFKNAVMADRPWNGGRKRRHVKPHKGKMLQFFRNRQKRIEANQPIPF